MRFHLKFQISDDTNNSLHFPSLTYSREYAISQLVSRWNKGFHRPTFSTCTWRRHLLISNHFAPGFLNSQLRDELSLMQNPLHFFSSTRGSRYSQPFKYSTSVFGGYGTSGAGTVKFPFRTSHAFVVSCLGQFIRLSPTKSDTDSSARIVQCHHWTGNLVNTVTR